MIETPTDPRIAAALRRAHCLRAAAFARGLAGLFGRGRGRARP